MRKGIKSGLKTLIDRLVVFAEKTSIGRYIYAQVIRNAMDRTQNVSHAGVNLIFSIPNDLNKYRADTFSTKEPETLEWIDGMLNDSIVWDIGANVGLYSCYAAKQHGCKVFSFEPSVFNLELLARNIFLNGLADQISIVPLPLSDALAINKLSMTTTEWGGALSTFGQEYGYDGQSMVNADSKWGKEMAATLRASGHLKVFEFPTIGLSMDQAVKFLDIPKPDYIKMDVDGIEHLILKGGAECLRAAKGVLIEVNDAFDEQSEGCQKFLLEAGLTLKEKRHADMFDAEDSFGGGKVWNQIWVRG